MIFHCHRYLNKKTKVSDEKKIKAEELSDEKLNEAAGGSSPAFGKEEKRCYKCGDKLPYNYPGGICKKCLESSSGSTAEPAGIQFPEPR